MYKNAGARDLLCPIKGLYKRKGHIDRKSLTLDQMWLLSLLPGVFGKDVFGKVESDSAKDWTWIISEADWEVHSDAFSTKELCAGDLQRVRCRLFPEWYDVCECRLYSDLFMT